MDLEVQVAAHRPGVPRLADVTHDLADVDEVAALEGGWMQHVRVEILARLAEALDDDEVAVEPGVVPRFTTGPVTAAAKVSRRKR